MEKIAVFVNDAAHARHILQPMLASGGPTHWILVATAPTLTRHIGRFVTQAARRQWLENWSTELFSAIEPALRAQAGSKIEKMLVKRPLTEVSSRLEARLGPMRLLDARRPRLGASEAPLTADQPASGMPGWAGPVAALTGLSAVLALAD